MEYGLNQYRSFIIEGLIKYFIAPEYLYENIESSDVTNSSSAIANITYNENNVTNSSSNILGINNFYCFNDLFNHYLKH